MQTPHLDTTVLVQKSEYMILGERTTIDFCEHISEKKNLFYDHTAENRFGWHFGYRNFNSCFMHMGFQNLTLTKPQIAGVRREATKMSWSIWRKFCGLSLASWNFLSFSIISDSLPSQAARGFLQLQSFLLKNDFIEILKYSVVVLDCTKKVCAT